jgi:plasmid maintenance system antidote protein VapI
MAKKKYTEQEMVAFLERLIEAWGLRATARHLDISAPFISDVIKGRRGFSSNLAVKMGFNRVYVKVEPQVWFERV